ncbi:MAG: TetR/AcrR family transcriptional regulator [Methylobacter sp.]|jgi:AcrR family transcriptional regulator|nr:TetR/AcrR family transcriptional regulator [Methylobacter sp.]
MINTPAPEITELSARDRILLTAHDLFYRDGIRATGVDKIIAEAGVTKVTFYRHFPSKNDLIRAFLDYRHQRWMNWFKEALARHGAQSGGGLTPLVPTLTEWFENPIYRGCAFINSVSELGTLAEVVKISKSHKQDMTEVLAELLPPSPMREQLATAVAIAVDGAIVKAQFEAGSDKAQVLTSLELLLIALAKV